VEDVVAAVSVDVCAAVPLMVTEAGERLQVAGLVAPEGAVETAQVSATLPVNEFAGVTVIVAVLPVVAPGLKVMFPLLERVKLLLPLGASQNPLHPASSGTAASIRRAHFPMFIAAPL
jgi:hypothetical protein